MSRPAPERGHATEPRAAWAERRLGMEARRERVTVGRRRRPRLWALFGTCMRGFAAALHATGLYERGVRNAQDVRLHRMDLVLPGLPSGFEGYRILHLSDLHLDFLGGATRAAAAHVASVEADLCVMTGDFLGAEHGPFEQILPPLRALVERVRAPDGILAVLGNHDSARMVEPFEALGLQVLANESVCLRRGGDRLVLTGTDDVHYYFTDRALEALRSAPQGFRVALVHSPELADHAAACGYRLYLCGHTHGGQVCLPGGIPLVTHLARLRRLASGRWRLGDLVGYTSRGTGVSCLPVRFHSRGEVVLLTLRGGVA